MVVVLGHSPTRRDAGVPLTLTLSDDATYVRALIWLSTELQAPFLIPCRSLPAQWAGPYWLLLCSLRTFAKRRLWRTKLDHLLQDVQGVMSLSVEDYHSELVSVANSSYRKFVSDDTNDLDTTIFHNSRGEHGVCIFNVMKDTTLLQQRNVGVLGSRLGQRNMVKGK